MCFYVLYVFNSYTKFGITWDEVNVYTRGKQLYQHLFIPKHNESAALILRSSQEVVDPTYNNTYAAILYIFNNKELFEIYHLLNLLFATLVFFFSYLFLYRKYKNPLFSILGPLFIVLNPRFFGHIATNPKDIPFAIFYFISIVTIYLISVNKNRLLNALILGVLFSLTQSSRVIGYTLYPILFLYDLYRWYGEIGSNKKHSSFLNFIYLELIYIAVIFICSNFFMVITWPYIGSSYFKNFINVLNTSGSFPWQGNIFFMGKEYFSLNLPLIYLPVWLLISQPIFITVSAIASLSTFKKSWKENGVLLLLMAPIAINFILYFILKPVIYDGIRHYLFLLPFFSTLAAVFVVELLNARASILKFIFMIYVVFNAVTIVTTQIKLFPYHYIYFNELVGGLKSASKNFETDYWNSSFSEAIAWLKKNEIGHKKKYYIYVCGYNSGMTQYLTENMEFVDDFYYADYAICYTRFKEYKNLYGTIVHIVMRDNTPLNYVIRNEH